MHIQNGSIFLLLGEQSVSATFGDVRINTVLTFQSTTRFSNVSSYSAFFSSMDSFFKANTFIHSFIFFQRFQIECAHHSIQFLFFIFFLLIEQFIGFGFCSVGICRINKEKRKKAHKVNGNNGFSLLLPVSLPLFRFQKMKYFEI